MARNCNELSLLRILLIFKRLQNQQTSPTSILISSDQHINIFRAGTYFPPSWKVRSWSPREYALGHQQKPLLVESKNYLEKVHQPATQKTRHILQIPSPLPLIIQKNSYLCQCLNYYIPREGCRDYFLRK